MPDGADQTQFMGLVQQLQGPLLSYCRRLTGNPQRAQEVVQEAILKLWNQDWKALGLGAKPWLYRVCRNECFDHLRKQKREQEMEPLKEEMTTAGPEQEHQKCELFRMLNSLQASEREIMLLKFQFGHSYQEICEITGFSYSKVSQSIHKGLGQMRKALVEGEKNEK